MTRTRRSEALLSFPSMSWLFIFFLVPSIVVFIVAFKPADPFGGVETGWTLETLQKLRSFIYAEAALRTIWISLVSAALCIALSLPCGFYIAKSSQRWQQRLLLLVVVPFWISFLVRIFAWRTLLHPDGFIKSVLAGLGIVSEEASLLYNTSAIVLVTVYTFLPFSILPIYAAVERFDFALLEAAFDLGASKLQTFFKVFIPGISRGIVTAALLVFIPALGSYIIPDLVGGVDGELLGNKIAQRVFTDRDLPQASAIAALLTLFVLVPLMGVFVLRPSFMILAV